MKKDFPEIPLSTPDAIFTADWHLRDSIPACREEDEFLKAQWDKVRFVSDLQKKYGCPVYHSGDLFDYWKPSLSLVAQTIEELPDNFYTNYGNHDLPQHSLELAHKCGIYLLEKAGKLKTIGTHWKQTPERRIKIKNRKVALWHVMTFQGSKPFPGCVDTVATGLLRKYPEYDLIVTGHNHQSFTEEYKGRVLLNCGCLTRQESDQAGFEPVVWLYFAETNSVYPIPLPHDQSAVKRPESVVKTDEREKRINAFISKLNTKWESSIDFEKNLENFLSENKTPETISQRVYNAIEQPEK